MQASTGTGGSAGGGTRAIVIIGTLYFIIGFVTWLNGPLISFVQLAFTLDDVGAFLIPLVFYLSYFFFSLPASWIMNRIGMKRGLALSLFVMAIGTALFGQFTTMRSYPGALGGLFVIGGGLSLLQTAVNPYISIIGPIESAARRIAIMGICNKAAGILAPVVLGALVLHGMGDLSQRVQAAASPQARAALLDRFAGAIYLPYMGMAAILVLSSIWIARSSLPEIAPDRSNAPVRTHGVPNAEGGALPTAPHLWLGVLCLFLYVGVEVMAGDAIGTYGRGFGLPLDQTKFFTAFTLGAMLAGYLLGLVLIPRVLSQERYLAVSAGLGILLSLAAMATTGYASVACVAALGIANAMMWPTIFPLAIRGLGRQTGVASALLVMGVSGGAILPQLFVHLKLHHDFQTVFTLIMVPSYLYILFYACVGYRAGMAPASRRLAA